MRKDLAEARAKLELTQQVCQDEPEGAAQQMQDQEPEARDVQYRWVLRDPKDAASLLWRKTEDVGMCWLLMTCFMCIIYLQHIVCMGEHKDCFGICLYALSSAVAFSPSWFVFCKAS